MDEFMEKVLNKFAGDITDRVFVMIQNDPKLMPEYLKLLGDNTLLELNAKIGKEVKERFNLKNDGRCRKLKSTLIIDSYEKHKIRHV